MGKISAFIIAKNEEKRIATAINSVKNIVDELIVIDSGSTDNTVAIAKELGATVVFRAWEGYVKQKVFGENLCKHDWILNLDADEELSKPLQDEIEHIFASNLEDRYHAYRINLLILRVNDCKPKLFAPANKFIRLYNRKLCSFANTTKTTTHDAVLFNSGVDGKVYDLNEVAYHRTVISIEQLVNKANFYSTEQAKDLIRLGRIPSKARIFSEMIIWFFKAFFIRRYFVFGFDGFVQSVIFAFARFIRLAKALEIYNNEKDSQK